MVVTCPQCAKRYMLDEALLPEEGRQVRCIACHHVWRQMRPISLHTSNPTLVAGTDLAFQANVISDKRSSWVKWLIFGIFLVSCISALVFGRSFIVMHWPKSEKYYELIGLSVTLPGSGLSIANASSQIYREGSAEMIRVMGSVINSSDRVRSIPPLKIKLVGKASSTGEERVLDHWEHRLSEQSLLPGEKLHFETDPRPKVEGTQHIRVEF